MLYKLDLHVHTKASKCFKNGNSSNEETNNAIIKRAKEKGLNLIAVTDHYSLKNYSDMSDLGCRENIKVIPGMELSLKTDSPEKLSLVVIFNEKIDVNSAGNKLLSDLMVPGEEQGNGKYLINKKLSDVLSILKKQNALIISAHQDKNEVRMLSVPVLIKLGICLFDLRYPEKKDEFLERYSRYNIIPLTFSDCHEADNVGKYHMSLSLKECSYYGFKDHIESVLRTNYED